MDGDAPGGSGFTGIAVPCWSVCALTLSLQRAHHFKLVPARVLVDRPVSNHGPIVTHPFMGELRTALSTQTGNLAGANLFHSAALLLIKRLSQNLHVG